MLRMFLLRAAGYEEFRGTQKKFPGINLQQFQLFCTS